MREPFHKVRDRDADSTWKAFESAVRSRAANPPEETHPEDALAFQIEHAIVGIVTEAGELADWLKKTKYTRSLRKEVNLIEEIGDVLWYVALLTNALGVPLSQVLFVNETKLALRHGGDSFSPEKCAARDPEAEEVAMQQARQDAIDSQPHTEEPSGE